MAWHELGRLPGEYNWVQPYLDIDQASQINIAKDVAQLLKGYPDIDDKLRRTNWNSLINVDQLRSLARENLIALLSRVWAVLLQTKPLPLFISQMQFGTETINYPKQTIHPLRNVAYILGDSNYIDNTRWIE